MTTYIVSQHSSYWHIDRYPEGDARDGIEARNEKEALRIALIKAKVEIPSQVLRVSMDGKSHLVAKFESKPKANS